MPIPSSIVASIREAERQTRTGDDWFWRQAPYVLEIVSSGLEKGSVFFVFPIAPKRYGIRRRFRKGVEPALGSLVVEEHGLLWAEITISGTFGFRPLTTIDSSTVPEGPVQATEPLSGPMWTRRLVRNFFETYGKLKTDPQHAARTLMIWHDLKTDDHYVVVPDVIDIDRVASSEGRLQYPFSISFIAVEREDRLVTGSTGRRAEIAVKTGFGRTDPIVAVNDALVQINSVVAEGSAYLGEVRSYAREVDQVLDNLASITESCTAFIEGTSDTISIGKNFIVSTANLIETMVEAVDAAAEIPQDVAANYRLAADSLDQIASQGAAFVPAIDTAGAAIADVERGAARYPDDELEDAEDAGPPSSLSATQDPALRSSDRARVQAGVTPSGRAFPTPAGFVEYTVRSHDTLQSIAAVFYDDSQRWYIIALANNLTYPYISETGLPGTVSPGDVLSIPVTSQNRTSLVAGNGADDVDLYGTSIALEQVRTGGDIGVELAIDRRTFRDCRLVDGPDNLAQSLQLRLWTEQGALKSDRSYGLLAAIGTGLGRDQLALLGAQTRRTLLQDSRVGEVMGLVFEVDGDRIAIDATISPTASTTSRQVVATLR